jgi:uncharacterized protein DUF1214
MAGARLNGANRYTVTFPKDRTPPVNGFWSLTLYNEHHFFAKNDLKRYSLGTKNLGSEIQRRRIAHHLCAGRSASRRIACQLATRAQGCRFLAVRSSLLAEGCGSRRRMDATGSPACGRHCWPPVKLRNRTGLPGNATSGAQVSTWLEKLYRRPIFAFRTMAHPFCCMPIQSSQKLGRGTHPQRRHDVAWRHSRRAGLYLRHCEGCC